MFSLLAVVVLAVVLGDGVFLELTNSWKNSFLKNLGWVYILTFIWIMVFTSLIAFKFSDYKIGGSDAKKEFSNLSWISMLFSAGLGTGLLYAGPLDPMSHFLKNEELSYLNITDRFIRSLEICYLHWGLPAWFVYSSAGLVFALMGFSFNEKFEFSALIPKQFKKLRVSINILAILSIIIGVITTFSLAVTQINAGFNKIFPVIKITDLNTSLIIIFITLLATFSVVSGLKRGIKFLSLLNIGLVAILFIYALLHTPIGEVIGLSLEVTGRHLGSFTKDLFYTASLKDKTWIGGWTILYWAWWGAWAPFVGLFIARISKGRSIKEFFLGTILAPTVIVCVWFTLFGFLSFQGYLDKSIDFDPIYNGGAPYLALFSVLDTTIFPSLATCLALVCVTIFYITSSDSGSYVVDMIASGGKKNPHSYLRVFWSLVEGLMAFVLFYFGGVELIQNLVILLSLPVVLYLAFGVYKVYEKLKTD